MREITEVNGARIVTIFTRKREHNPLFAFAIFRMNKDR